MGAREAHQQVLDRSEPFFVGKGSEDGYLSKRGGFYNRGNWGNYASLICPLVYRS